MSEDESAFTLAAPPADGIVRYGPLPDQTAELRYGGAAHDRPLVIVIHGGFWRPKYDRSHTAPQCAALAADGWTVASIEYRRAPGHPDQTLDDVQTAVTVLPAMVAHHDGRVILMGHSAGGHLALFAASTLQAPIVGVVGLGPVADLHYAHALHLGDDAVAAFLGTTPDTRPDVDPCLLNDPAATVTLVHGEDDVTVPIALSEHYVARHPAARLVRLTDCGHVDVIDPRSRAWSAVITELRRLGM